MTHHAGICDNGDLLQTQRAAEADLASAIETALYDGRLGEIPLGQYRALNRGVQTFQRVMQATNDARPGELRDRVLGLLVPRFLDGVCAAFRLVTGGYFDVAFAPVRVVAELANLMQLFDADTAAMDEWFFPHGEMRDRFVAFAVTARLEALGTAPLFGESALTFFASAGVHSTPSSANEMLGHSAHRGDSELDSPISLVWAELVYALEATSALGIVRAPLDERTHTANRLLDR